MNIFNDEPANWRDLEKKVGIIFNDMNYYVEIEKDLKTVRGNVNVDVYLEDNSNVPKFKYLCECKYWNANVPQTVIHAFRTVVNDYGANAGYLITKKGFQSGSYKSIKNSNIYLLTWDEFIILFKRKWLNSMIHKLHRVGTPLRDYTDILDLEFYTHAKELGSVILEQFKLLVKKYQEIAAITSKVLYTNNNEIEITYVDAMIEVIVNNQIIQGEIMCYYDFFNYIIKEIEKGINDFDELLGVEFRKSI